MFNSKDLRWSMDDINIINLIKKAFRSMIDDPGYIILYLIPILINIIPIIYIWFIFDDLQNLNYTNLQNQQYIIGLFRDNIVLLIVIMIVYIFIYLIITTIITGGFIKKVDFQEKNEKIGIKDSISYGLRIFPRLFTAQIIGSIILFGPFVLLIFLSIFSALNKIWGLLCFSLLFILIIGILWIYIGIRISLYPYACVIDKKGPVECFKRSLELTKGNVLLIFALYLIVFAIYFIFIIPSNIFSYLEVSYIATLIYGLIISTFFTPLFTLTFSLLYISLSKTHTK